MKRRGLLLLLLLAAGLFCLSVQNIYAGSSYSRATAYLKTGSPTGGGKVYLGTAATSSPSYASYNSSKGYFMQASVKGGSKTTNYHFYAQANAGYKFTGWYTKSASGDFVKAANSTVSSTTYTWSDAHYVKAVTSAADPSGTEDSYTDFNLYASFVKIIQYSFIVPTNGSYTITNDGATVANYSTFTVDGTVVLSAMPDAGYKVKGWYTTTNGGTTKNYFDFSDTVEPNFTSNTTIGVEFMPDDGKATFWVKGTTTSYTDLNAANTAAASSSSKLIVVVSSGTIPAGTYTISSGVTLLIPYTYVYDKMTTPNVVHITGISSAPALKVYKTLSLAPGAVINCSGNICVGGSLMAINGGNPSSLPRGNMGVLDLSRGGTVNLNSGSTLYAWGFVQGQDMSQGNNTTDVGEIIAKSGSTVWEDFQVGEWRGGTASSTIYNNKSSWKFFPFQSYTVQNIEAPITYQYGSTGKCYWAIYGNGQTYTVNFSLIATSNSLFKLGSGASLKKWYDPTTDRVCYSMSGTASLEALNLSAMGTSISSKDYNLPVPANMHIVINSGTTTIGNPMVMHAGSVVEIKNGATLQLNSNCYMFDQTDWDTYCMYAWYFRTYANLTNHYDRDATNAGWNYNDGKVKTLLEDARLVVDGTLKFGSSGRLYSSTNGSAIVGNGGGQVIFGTLPTTTTIVMCKELSNNTNVSVSSANLCNDDNTYTKSIASTTFKNINGRWFTSAASTIKSDKTYDFTYIKSGAVYGTGGTNATVAAVYSHDKTGILDRMKWANVKSDVCTDWWAGLNDTYLYNWTLNSDWHQYQPTGTTIGSGDEAATVYSGSDNKLYTKLDCTFSEYGGTDANCLYTVDGVKKAFVDGAFVALVKNTDDEAYHKSDAATTYYICFSEGCNWHPATKVSGTSKAYTVEGQDYIWYDGAWLAATKDGTFYYSLDEHNVRVYYEYVSNAWTLATPVAEVTNLGVTEQKFKIAEAFTDANSLTGAGAATTIKLLKNVSVSSALSYTGNGNTILDLNGFTLSSSVANMITINGASSVLIVIDQSSAGTGKVQLSYSANARRYAVSVTKGHFILNSGTVSATNTMAYNSSSAKTVDVGGVTVASGHKFTMNGGRLEAISDHNPYGVNIASSTTSVVTINGGTIEAKTTERSSSVDSPYGIYGYGKIIVNGGTIKATCYRSSSSRGISVFGSLEMKGGEVIASGTGTIYGVHVGTATTPTATITGGTITATATGGTVRGIISYGTTTISGGTINATAGTSDARGVFAYNTATTINAGATINATAKSDARALFYGSGTPTVTVNGGTFNATTNNSTDAYGIYADKGTGIINDGEFIVTAKTNTAYGMFVATANTPTLTVNGGKFKVTSEASSPTNILLCNSDAATANFVINGGYYNLAKNENVTTGTEDGYTTYPNLSIAKYKASGKLVKNLDATIEASLISAGYGCKVAGKEYTVTWCKMGGNTGSNILKTEKWESGKVPVWTDPDPNLNSTGVTRIFTGWNTDIWNRGTSYKLGTPLPAITDHDVTYYAINTPIYAEVISGGKDSLCTSIKGAWNYAMTKTQATIRILTQLGTEASISNCTQLVFNPANANSIITLDLNGLSWTMGDHSTASENKDVFLLVSPEKANCKLIVTDNSASGGGYLMNKWACTTNLLCANVTAGELILQGGGLKVNNTTAENNAVGVQVNGGKFTMTGGMIDSKKEGDAVTAGTASGVYAYSATNLSGGTIKVTNAKNYAIGVHLMRNNFTTELSDELHVITNGSQSFGVYGYGTVDISGGTYDVTAEKDASASWTTARGICMFNSSTYYGKATVTGNPVFNVNGNTGGAYGVYTYSNANVETVVEGGTFNVYATNGNMACGVTAQTSGVSTIKGGTFNCEIKTSGKNNAFGVYVQQAGTVNVEGGTFNVTAYADGGNNDAVRIAGHSTDNTAVLNISGGEFTMNKGGYALRSFGGTTNISGNPKFTARYGIDVASWAGNTCTCTVIVDGGSFIATVGEAARCYTTTTTNNGNTNTLTGDLTIWDGKFFSPGTTKPVVATSTSNIKIRGGYYSSYTSSNVSDLSKYVVSPSTTEAYATTIDGKDYTYRVNTKYTVTWKNKAGTTTVETQEYNRNEIPTHAAYVPDDGNTYEFTGWNTATDGSGDTIQSVTSDIIYYAQYTKYLAEVIEGEATSGTRYEKFSKAWAVAQNMPVATIKILSNFSSSTEFELKPDSVGGAQSLTIDLNGHTVTCSATTATAAFKINKAGCKLIIDDSGSDGVLRHQANASATVLYGIKLLIGELELKGGTLSARNTCIDGVSGAGVRTVFGSAGTTFTMSGGTLLARSRLDPRAYGSDGASVFNATGGTITARTDYTEDSTTKYGTNAYGVVLWNNGTFNMSGTTKISILTGLGALGVYAYGANAVANIAGGTVTATTKTGSSAVCTQAGNSGTLNITGGTFNARTAATWAVGVYAAEGGIVNVDGGTFDSQSTAADLSSIWNIEGIRVSKNANVVINGGSFSSSKGASPIGVGVRGGTTTINGGTFNSTRGLYAMDYADGTQTATVTINGGTFIATAEAVRAESKNRVIDSETTYKANANVTVNGGYFYSTGSAIVSLIQTTDGVASTLVLNGGKYCEKSGTTYKTQINALKGATTTVTDISETVSGKSYAYELKTPFSVTWNAGTSYTKTETLQSGTTPTNTAVTSFVRNDSTFYFTNWTPTPAPVYGDVTYNAEGVYYQAKVKIGSGAWTNYEDFLDAWDAVQNSTNATTYITLLNNVTLADKILHKPTVANAKTTFDLNNFTLSIGGTTDRLLEFNKSDAVLTITDGSTAKGGSISMVRTLASALYTVVVHNGELKMTGGRLYAEQNQNDGTWRTTTPLYLVSSDNAKLTMTGGTLEAKAKYCAFGLYTYGTSTISGGTIKAVSTNQGNAVGIYAIDRTTTVSGTATIDVSGTKSSTGAQVTGWVSNDGQTRHNATLNIQGGTINVTADKSNVCGFQVYAVTKNVSGTVYGAHGILNITGGTANVTCSDTTATQIFGVQCQESRVLDSETPHHILGREKGEANISGGTINVDTRNAGAWVKNGGNVDMLRSWGTMTVTGGTFNLYQYNSPRCISNLSGKITISGSPAFNVLCGYGVRGVDAAMWCHSSYCDADATKNLCEVEINGGTFNLKATTENVIGVMANGSISTTSATDASALAGYAMSSKVTVNGGTFVCTAPKTVRCFYQYGPVEGTYGTATRTLIVNGGKFKSQIATVANDGTIGTVANTGANIETGSSSVKLASLTGGYYINNNQLAAHVSDTCKVTEITSASVDAEYNNGYRYKIEPQYVAKVQSGSTTKYYTTVLAAMNYAKTVAAPTITILKDAPLTARWVLNDAIDGWQGTLDLNGKTVTAAGMTYGLIDVTKAGIKLTIKDSSTGGKLLREDAGTAIWGVNIDNGATLELQSGTIHVVNTMTSISQYTVGVCINTNGGTFNLKGGKVEVHAEKNIFGLSFSGNGTANLSGGELSVNPDLTSTLGSTVYAIRQAVASTVTVSGTAKVSATANDGAYSVYQTNGTLTISGTADIDAEANTNAYGLYSSGSSATATISGGTIDTNTKVQDTGASNGVYVAGGANVTISGGTVTSTTDGTSTANIYAVKTGLNGTLNISGGTFNGGTDGNKYQAVNIRGGNTTISGGTFNAATGVRAMDWADAATITGVLTIDDATFNCTAAVFNISSMANNSRDGHVEVTVTGGKFKTTGDNIIIRGTDPSGTTASTFTITGGFFNEKSGTTFKSQISNYVSDPYEVFTLEDGDANKTAGYSYEVCEKRVAKVQVGSAAPTYYTTVAAAFTAANAATDPSTITMLKDAPVTGTLRLGNTDGRNCTLDLNGHTITSTTNVQYPLIVRTSDGSLTITDGTESKSGKIAITTTYTGATNNPYGVYVYQGTVTLNAGTIDINSSTDTIGGVSVRKSQTFTMNGGTVKVSATEKVAYGVNSSGTTTINNGTVQVSAKENAYCLVRSGGTFTVEDGKFNVSSTGATAYMTNKSAAIASLAIKGGWYNTDTYLKPNAPYHVFDLTGQSPYLYEVAEGYTLTWNLDGGTVSTEGTPAGYVKKGASLTAPTVTKTGYTFASWSPAVAATMPAANTTYTATWTCVSPSALSVASEGNKWDFCAGETMTLTVSGSNIAADATYQWKLGGTNIAGATAATYTTTMAAAKAGAYTCTVTNGTCSTTTSDYYVRLWQLYINNGTSDAWQALDFTNTEANIGENTTVALTSDKNYRFKLKDNNGGWFGLNSKTVTRTESAFALNGTGADVNVQSGMAGNYTFTINYSDKNNPTIAVTYPTANQPAGRDIWFDKSVITGWGDNIFYRIGHPSHNTNNTKEGGTAWTLVPGTDNFYTTKTMSYDGFEAWQIANNASWADDNSIYMVNGSGYAITKATNFQKYVVGESGVTVVPTTSNNTENGCNYWNVAVTDGMLTHTATVTAPANGTITLAYTDVNNAAQSKTATTSGLAHRTKITATATPAAGYQLSTFTVTPAGGLATSLISGDADNHILSKDATFAATFSIVTYNITYDLAGGTAGTPANPTTYNVETANFTLSNPTRAGYTFAGWTGTGLSVATTTVTIPTGSTGDRSYTATWALNVAEVTINGTTTPYTTLADAFEAANASETYEPTIKILQNISGITAALQYSGAKNCTLDLNGHTVESTARYMLYMSPSNNTPVLTITDLTSQKEGKLWQKPSGTSTSYTVYIAKGKVVLEAGTIGGESSSAALIGVQVTNSSSRSFTMNGGKIEITTTNSKIGYGIVAYGKANINAGKIDVQAAGTAYGIDCRNTQTTIKASVDFYIRGTTAYAARVGGHTPTATTSYNGTLTIEGGTFDVEASNGNAYGVDVYTGTFTATDETIYHTAGTANISGGTFTVNAKTASKYAYGVQVQAALTDPVATPKATITGGKFNVTATTTARAYATNTKAAATALLVQGGWYSLDNGLANYIAPTKTSWNYYKFTLTGQSPYLYEVAEGATVTWDATTNGGSCAVSSTVVKKGTAVGTLPEATKANHSFDGWFTTYTGSGNQVVETSIINFNQAFYARFTPDSYTVTLNTNGGTINAGNVTAYTYGVGATLPTDVSKTDYEFGGWYDNSELSGSAVTAITTTDAGDKEYWAKWTLLDFGQWLDVVDWTSTGEVILNMNGYTSATAKANWKVVANGTTYTKTDRDDATKNPAQDRTMRVDLTGLNLSAGDKVAIQALGTADVIESYHSYTVPYIFNSSATLTGTTAQSIVYVHSGTLTVSGNQTVGELYVAPGAELNIANGATLTVEKLVLRTNNTRAAILTNNGTLTIADGGQMYYSRQVSDKSSTYQLALPFDVTLANITLSNGKAAGLGNHYALMTYNAERRATEGIGGNWESVQNTNSSDANYTTKIDACKGYQLLSGSQYYYEFMFPVSYSGYVADNASVTVHTYGDPQAKPNDYGWNYICSPYTDVFHAKYDDPSDAIKVAWLVGTSYWEQDVKSYINPLWPFYYQSAEEGELSFSSSEFIFRMSALSANKPVQTQWIRLQYSSVEDASNSDRANLYLHPDKFADGFDKNKEQMKLSTTGDKAFVYFTMPYGDLAFAALSDSIARTAGVPVSVYANHSGSMTFSLEQNDYLGRINHAWLIDKATGEQTDLLTDSYTYFAEQGTCKDRFLLRTELVGDAVETPTDLFGAGAGNVRITVEGKSVVVTGDVKGLQCFDALGRLLQAATQATEVRIEVPAAGVYLIMINGNLHKVAVP